jgi:hypothetical protein
MVDRTLFDKPIPIQRETMECCEAPGKAKKNVRSQHGALLVSPETKERLEALKYDHKESLGDVVLRLTNGYFTND